MSFTAFGLVGAAVLKAFHISNDLGEMKEILRDIRRNLEDRGGPAITRQPEEKETRIREMSEAEYASAIQAKAMQSAAPLLRAVNTESQLPALSAEVLNAPPTHNS